MFVTFLTSLAVFLFFYTVQPLSANEGFYGIIEKRPEGKVGKWVIGGRPVDVTEQTELDDDNIPLKSGCICRGLYR